MRSVIVDHYSNSCQCDSLSFVINGLNTSHGRGCFISTGCISTGCILQVTRRVINDAEQGFTLSV
jgi:hypothetical protein